MPLPLLIAKLDEVEEPFRTMYEETDDGFMLAVEDSGYKSKLNEFRDNNRKLSKSQESLQATADKYKDVDLDKYQKAMEALGKLEEAEDKELLSEGKIEELLDKRTQNMRKDYEVQIKSKSDAYVNLEEERNALRDKLGGVLVDTAVQNAVNKVGRVRSGALDDVLNRARSIWKIDAKGDMVPRKNDGSTEFGAKGDPLTMDEWATNLITGASFLFEGSKGSGGGGGSGGGMEGGKQTIDGNDLTAFGNNLEKIASGEITVKVATTATGD